MGEKGLLSFLFFGQKDEKVLKEYAEMVGVELGELIEDAIMGMRESAAQLGLAGDVS